MTKPESRRKSREYIESLKEQIKDLVEMESGEDLSEDMMRSAWACMCSTIWTEELIILADKFSWAVKEERR